MVAAASALILLGILALIVSILLKMRAGKVTKTPFLKTAQIAQQAPGSAVSVEGKVLCPQPLVAPYSGTPCLYYEITVTAEWKEGDTRKSKDIKTDKVAARFAIDDGSGPVTIDAAKGGTFPTSTKSETKSTGLVAGITGGELMFGNYSVSTGVLALGTKYTLREELMTVHPHLYVNGAVAAGGGITTPSGLLKSLLLSEETRDGLLASSLKNAKLTLIGGGAGLAVGIILAVVNAMISPKSEAVAAPVASASASVAAALPAAEPSVAPTASAHAVTPEPVAPHAAGAAHAAVGAKPSAAAAGTTAAAGTAAAKPAGAAAAGGAKPAATAAAGAKIAVGKKP